MQKSLKKVVLQEDLVKYTKYFFKKSKGYDFLITKNFHQKVLEAFQKVIFGEIKRLLILAPPRLGKTEMARMFCSMGFAQNPASEFIYICSDSKLALDCSSEIRKVIKMPSYQEFWSVNLRYDADAKGLWKTEDGGSFWAGGFGSPVVGYGAGKFPTAKKNFLYDFVGALIVDDPLKEQDRHRLLVRENATKFFFDTLPDRLNDKKNTPIIVVMQPLHPEDLGQYIKKNCKEFIVLEFPILDKNGESLVPELLNKEDILKLRSEKSNEIWQAKYMMKPIKLGGGVLKTKFLKTYNELPVLKKRWIEVDTAQKTEEIHDYTVFQCWGKGKEGGIYLIDQFRKKIEYSELKISLKEFWSKHNSNDFYDVRRYGYLTSCFIEDKSSGTPLIQECRQEGNISVVSVQRNSNKFERAVNIALPKLEAGYINIPEDADFSNDLRSEIENFTGEEYTKQSIIKISQKERFDDQVDCLISACEHGFSEFTTSDKIVESFLKKKLTRNNKNKLY